MTSRSTEPSTARASFSLCAMSPDSLRLAPGLRRLTAAATVLVAALVVGCAPAAVQRAGPLLGEVALSDAGADEGTLVVAREDTVEGVAGDRVILVNGRAAGKLNARGFLLLTLKEGKYTLEADVPWTGRGSGADSQPASIEVSVEARSTQYVLLNVDVNDGGPTTTVAIVGSTAVPIPGRKTVVDDTWLYLSEERAVKRLSTHRLQVQQP